MIRFFTRALGLTLFLFLAGCGTHDVFRSSRAVAGRVPSTIPRAEKHIESYPWISWGEGESLSGTIVPVRLIEVDKQLSLRNIAGAEQLLAGVSGSGSLDDLVRVAAVTLAKENGSQTIKLLSGFYTSRKLSENAVSGPIAILFAYGYGLLNDPVQSVAWFSRNIRRADKAPDARPAPARQGLELILRSLPTETINSIRDQWRDEEEVDKIFSNELTQRTVDPSRKQIALASLWTIPVTPSTESLNAEASPVAVVEKWRILGLLPLTGKYAALATSVRQGIELASAEHAPPDVEVVIRDDSGSFEQEKLLLSQSNSSEKLLAVVGPLTVESAQALQYETQQLGIPQLSFPRGRDFMPTGTTYRFGLTADAQVASLLTAYTQIKSGASIVAIVPDDESGNELAESLQRVAPTVGVTIAHLKFIQKGSSASLTSAALELETLNPDAVFFGDNLIAASRFFSALPVKLRKSITPLGTALWDDIRTLQQSRTVLEGAMFPVGLVPPVPGGVSEHFAAAYQERFSKEANFLSAQGYDATTLLLQGLQQVGERRRVTLDGQRLNGVSGQTIVHDNGEIERILPVVRFIDGQIRAVQP